ncbi:sugar ABC transporter permease [Acrocarpospora phusangensis]|uniref:Sugar ABC transporter permease n=1 Tax=Acrocarpospora phusangensis TaxID=1070424 RepID=A0A919UNT4_9ACTN|nr:carbohydrate ABC transporter permease [Acrocarpospora phusangensis]GIH24872.1 sugar ABC transporter permease [Acrocarpospora phusangensis]
MTRHRAAARPPAVMRAFATLVLVAGALVAMAPFVWMIATSFKQPQDVFTPTPQLLPLSSETGAWAGTFDNYLAVFDIDGFTRAFVNSVLVVVVLVPAKVLLAAMAGYAFARIRFPGRDRVFAMILATIMLPGVALLVPKVFLTQELGMGDSLSGLIVPSLVSAFDIFLFRQFFLTLPQELEEAAKIDGAGWWLIFRKLALPLAKPALAVVTITAFIFHWNDFLWPLVILTDQEKYTLPLALQALASGRVAQPHLVMAGAVVAVMPVVAVFLIFQRRILDGIQFTGLK